MAREMERWFSQKLAEINAIPHEVAATAAQEGKEITRDLIETSGTVKSGKRGRIETGAMRDAVDGKDRRVSATEAEARWGWLTGAPEYAGLQEHGFAHVGGVTVDGMYSLDSSKDDVMAHVRDEVKRRISDL